MWLLPSRRRPFYLKNFFAACADSGLSTPGRILVDSRDFADLRPEYEALKLPPDWEFIITEKERMGDKIGEVWSRFISLPWLGILNDDHLPRTYQWDLRVIESLNGWNCVSTDDGNFPGHPAGATCWSGELLRTVGFMFPGEVYHLFIDTAWAYLGRATGCWHIRTDVMVEHFDAGNSGLRDETFRLSRDNFEIQEQAYLTWRRNEGDACIEKIRQLRDRCLNANAGRGEDAQYYRANDLFARGEFSQAVVELEKFLNLKSARDPALRATAYIQLARAHAALRAPGPQIIQYMKRAVTEAPRVRFIWGHMAELMAVLGDWPSCFKASVSALKGLGPPSGIMVADPALEVGIPQLLELSSTQLLKDHGRHP